MRLGNCVLGVGTGLLAGLIFGLAPEVKMWEFKNFQWPFLRIFEDFWVLAIFELPYFRFWGLNRGLARLVVLF